MKLASICTLSVLVATAQVLVAAPIPNEDGLGANAVMLERRNKTPPPKPAKPAHLQSTARSPKEQFQSAQLNLAQGSLAAAKKQNEATNNHNKKGLTAARIGLAASSAALLASATGAGIIASHRLNPQQPEQPQQPPAQRRSLLEYYYEDVSPLVRRTKVKPPVPSKPNHLKAPKLPSPHDKAMFEVTKEREAETRRQNEKTNTHQSSIRKTTFAAVGVGLGAAGLAATTAGIYGSTAAKRGLADALDEDEDEDLWEEREVDDGGEMLYYFFD